MSMKPTITIHITFLSSGLKQTLGDTLQHFINGDQKHSQNPTLKERELLHEPDHVVNGFRSFYPDINYPMKSFEAQQRSYILLSTGLVYCIVTTRYHASGKQRDRIKTGKSYVCCWANWRLC